MSEPERIGDASLHLGDALEVMAGIDAGGVNLIVADPPYYKVKAEAWDRQWKTAAEYLGWLGRVLDEFRRVLAPNGSLYVFASPRMAARVECLIGERFEVLNHIVWNKLSDYAEGDRRATAYRARDHESFRRFFDYSERIIFAEQFGADSSAMGSAGYAAKCDELRGFVFEPVLRYIQSEFQASGLSRREVDEHFATSNVSQYWLQARDFIIPTPDRWAGLQTLRPGFFRREYEGLRREYEGLRREYEDLRRPFNVSASVPYTDVWDFPTVPARPGKHPCEKPAALVRHIVSASSRPRDLVLDPFAGSGVTGEACEELGRRCILVESNRVYHERARRRLRAELDRTPLLATEPAASC